MRRATICPAEKPICPSCGEPIRRVTVPPDGGIYAYCDNKPHQGTGRRARCGQHVYAVGMAGRLCAVVPISGQEFHEFTTNELTIRQVADATEVLR